MPKGVTSSSTRWPPTSTVWRRVYIAGVSGDQSRGCVTATRCSMSTDASAVTVKTESARATSRPAESVTLDRSTPARAVVEPFSTWVRTCTVAAAVSTAGVVM